MRWYFIATRLVYIKKLAIKVFQMWNTTGSVWISTFTLGKHLLSKDNKIHINIIPDKKAYSLVNNTVLLYIHTHRFSENGMLISSRQQSALNKYLLSEGIYMKNK